MHLEAEQALRDADELLLVTRGRRSGREHAVTLRFAYADGSVWLRTEPRDAPKSLSKEATKELNVYALPKPTKLTANAAATTNQP